MRRSLPLAAALLLLSSVTLAACSGGSDTPEWEGETIRIGSIFSTSGDGTDYGPQQLRAARLAIDQVNSDGGGVNGAKLKLVQQNDASDPARSKEAMGNLIRTGKVMAVMGPTFSNSAVEADPLADQLETTVLAVSNTAPGIVGDCPYPCRFVFRDSLGEAEAIPANIAAASGVSGETAAIVYPSGDPFGATTAGIARDAFRKEGIRVTAMTTSPAGLATAIGGKPDLLEYRAQGPPNGGKLKLVQRNDASDPARSKEAMGNLISAGKVMAVIGPTFSNSAVEADPLADQLETTVLAVSNTAPGIVGDCPYPCRFVFRDSLGEAEAIP
ncbi:MAG: ABC transporter substrate-binding protein, partial [Solirubrobacterales bacterium]